MFRNKKGVRVEDPRRFNNGKKTKEYLAWGNMKGRCHNPNHPQFHLYGGRGIAVCEEWRLSFDSFITDMGAAPATSLWIERVDNNKGYMKENCKWATRLEQQNNRRNNNNKTIDGTTDTLTNWCRESNMSVNTVSYRLKCGLSIETALNKPVKKNEYLIDYNGVVKSLSKWAQTTGLSRTTIPKRIESGWSIEAALSTAIASPPMKITVNGITDSMSGWARSIGMPIPTIHKKLKLGLTKGVSPEQIVKELLRWQG